MGHAIDSLERRGMDHHVGPVKRKAQPAQIPHVTEEEIKARIGKPLTHLGLFQFIPAEYN